MHSGSDSDESVEPEEFSDPITLSIMEEAMMATVCGHSFSKESITRWLRQNHPSCPVCKQSLIEGQLIPNYALRSAIERYLSKHGGRKNNDSDDVDRSVPYSPSTEVYMPPDPIKPSPSSSASAPPYPGIDEEADAPPAEERHDEGDVEEGCLQRLTKEAQESDQGCCVCACEGPVYCCKTAHEYERRGSCLTPKIFPWYRHVSISGLMCVYCYGTNSTYLRRTVTSVCLPPYVLLMVVLMILEIVFLTIFFILALFLFSPIYSLIRLPIIMLCPIYYESNLKNSCLDATFGCNRVWASTPRRRR